MGEEHPIQGLMTTAMNSIKDMVDVNTIVGEAVEANDGTVIIPISRVCFGFAAGGGEYGTEKKESRESKEEKDGKSAGSGLPFGGGSGAGVSINPVGFLVVGKGQIRLLPVGNNSSIDRLLDIAPDLMNRLNDVLRSKTKKTKKIEISDDEEVVEESKENY